MTIIRADYRFLAALTVAAIAAPSAYFVSHAQTPPQVPARTIACSAPAELTKFNRPLARTARLLSAGKPITIVALGSSSTAGAGASSPAATYPSRLEADLKQAFPLGNIHVLNRGINGVEVRDVLEKLDQGMSADKPDLVLWQLGTNSLLRDRALADSSERIGQGLAKLKKTGVDAILINPQYAPKVIAKPEVGHMVELIAKFAQQANINVFDRYAVMKYWRVSQNIPFGEFLSPDELHMNDWSYACTAKLLANAIKEAATRPAQTATSAPAVHPR